jgi:hypothetical protein
LAFTRLQIVRELKERGWTRSRSRWYAPKGFDKYLRTFGIDLRAAASLEALASSENLNARRAKCK